MVFFLKTKPVHRVGTSDLWTYVLSCRCRGNSAFSWGWLWTGPRRRHEEESFLPVQTLLRKRCGNFLFTSWYCLSVGQRDQISKKLIRSHLQLFQRWFEEPTTVTRSWSEITAKASLKKYWKTFSLVSEPKYQNSLHVLMSGSDLTYK